LALQRKGDKAAAATEFQKAGELDARFKSPTQ